MGGIGRGRMGGRVLYGVILNLETWYATPVIEERSDEWIN